MKKALLIFITIVLMSSEALNSQASASVQMPQTERLQAQDSKSSDPIEIRFEGLRSVQEADVLKALRTQFASFSEEDLKYPFRLMKAAHAIKDYLAARGYLNAVVTMRKHPATAATKGVTFIVYEGARAHINEIEFEGNKFLSDEQLLDSIKLAGKKYGFRCLPSDEYDSEVFESCLRLAASHLRSKGYLQLKLGTPKRRENVRGLTLIVPVTEGELYRLGAIKIEGGTIFTPEQMTGMLDLKAGDVANADAISHWLQQKLKDAYGEMGYIQYEYDIEPDFQSPSEIGSGGVVNLQITISEGKRFFVSKIKFLNAAQMSDEELRRLLYIHEGEPFNQKKLIESVNDLHRLGLSDRYDERNVDYRTSEEEGLIDIVLTLKGHSTRAAKN